jgi:hypothetical protein
MAVMSQEDAHPPRSMIERQELLRNAGARASLWIASAREYWYPLSVDVACSDAARRSSEWMTIADP